jgi:broad specificity phosphatase PhoE
MDASQFDRANWFCTNVIIVRHGQSDNNTTYELIRSRFGDSLTPEQFEVELNKIHEPDCSVSSVGVSQSKALAEHIAAGKLNTLKQARSWKVLSSPMKRCLMTTQLIAAGFGPDYPVTVHPRFFESDGCFKKDEDGNSVGMPGMTKAEVEGRFPGFQCLPGMENGWFADRPGKETAGEFKLRTEELIDVLWTMHGDHLRDAQQRRQQEVLEGVPDAEKKPLDDRDLGYFIVAHGNLIRALISKLLGTFAMVAVDNTGLSFLQLWSTVDGQNRFASVQYCNRVDHLLHIDGGSLVSGSDIFDDHWIQEYLIPDHV